MKTRYDINKKLLSFVLDEITDKNLPINCTIGKTVKEVDDYMTAVTFTFEDFVNPVFDDMMCRCINKLSKNGGFQTI